MKDRTPHPPKWADRLLSWFCREEVIENIQGDLYEIYQKRTERIGQRNADLLFAWDVLSMVLRPRLIKKFVGSHHVNLQGISRSYFKSSLRTIRHNAFFTGVNVVGLAISMSVGLLMIVTLSELHSFDEFHDKRDRIYRVTTSRKSLFQGEADIYATTSHYIGDQIAEQAPGIEQVLILDRKLTADLKTENKGIAVAGYYASASFFDVLSFKVIKGDSRTALDKPGAIVLTQSTATKLFGDADPIDKTIAVGGNEDFQVGVVTAVTEDPPINSHIRFEVLVSMATMENSLSANRRKLKNNPGNYAQSYVYVVLNEGARVADIEAILAKVMADHNARSAPMTLALQPMKQFVTSDMGYQPGSTFSSRKVDMMMGLAFIVILSACFNYSNLSLVRALRRSKEISVRKITGATRLHIFLQFIVEAVLLSLIALMVAIGFFFIIRPGYLDLSNFTTGSTSMFVLEITPLQVMYFFLLAIGVGCIAGFFPALILSKVKANALFNDASRIKLFSGISARQILTTGQIALSIGLIMCAAMVHKQYQYALNYSLGYNTDNIVNIKVQNHHADALENEYAKMPDVVETSRSSVILGTRNMIPAEAMSEDRSDTIMFSSNYIDNKYLAMHGFELIAGTGFLKGAEAGAVPDGIIVNERFLKELELGSPHDAIGKRVWYFEDAKVSIQGVVKDFVSMSLDAEAPESFGFLHGVADENAILGVKILSSDLLTTMHKLEKGFQKVDPVHPFEAMFYHEQIARTYAESRTTYTIVSFLAFLAISISTLGLLGTAVFSIETRMKEISIRKVLGASIINLVMLLSGGLLAMIAIGAAIAIPVSLYLVDHLVLNKYLYRTEMGLVEMLSGLAIVLLIGVITIAWQARAAALRNISELLRKE